MHLSYKATVHALRCTILGVLVSFATELCGAEEPEENVRRLIGWGWEERPHGQTLASDVLGQSELGNPALPSFGSYGPYGGPKRHGFFFFAFNAGRYQVAGGPAAHLGIRKLAVPDYWNHRVLLFDLRDDGSLEGRSASGLIGQERFDQMEIGQGPARFHYPSAATFDPSGKYLFVADEYNHRVLQFSMSDPRQAVCVYGQRDFEAWGHDGTAGDLMWDSTRDDIRGPKLVRATNSRGLFLPRGVASDGRRLFVSDGDNHRVVVFDVEGSDNGPEAVAVLGQKDFNAFQPNRGQPQLGLETVCFPGGLALDPSHRYLLVADSLNLRTLVFDVAGPIKNGMPAVASVHLPNFEPRDQPNPPFQRTIAGALDVAVDDKGRMYVADRSGLRVAVHRLERCSGRQDGAARGGRPLRDEHGLVADETRLWRTDRFGHRGRLPLRGRTTRQSGAVFQHC